MSLLDCVELDTAEPVRRAVIWLHGLGADGNDFVPIVGELGLPGEPGIRFVFPHAPVRPVTLNGGMPMRAWFDVTGLDRSSQPDSVGIDASIAATHALIAHELERGLSAADIVLAGFSQGGVIALHAGLTYGAGLAGIIALSTYLPLDARLRQNRHAANATTPVLFAHGEFDPVLAHAMGRESFEAVEAMGNPVQWHSYPMAHQVCAEEIGEIGRFLIRALKLS